MMIFTFLPKHLVPYSPEKTEIMQEGDKRRNGDSYFLILSVLGPA